MRFPLARRIALATLLGVLPVALAQSTDQQQVLQLDRAWADAEIRHDAAALDRILDDAFVVTGASGKTRTKQEFLKSFTSPSTETSTQDLTDRLVHISGDTAVVNETDNYAVTDAGHTSTGHLRLTTTYVRRGDHWIALAEQMTTITPKGDAASAEDDIRQLDSDWVAAAQSKDVAAWLNFYADDATVLPPNEQIASGKTAARKPIAELLGLPGLSLLWAPTKVDVAKSGELAYLTGTYDMSFNDPSGRRISDIGKLLEVWKLQPDGKWKCVADTWNSDLPATP